ncbi:head decoration protein [Sphingomonas sp. UYP23]
MGVPSNTVLIENRREGGYVVWDPSDGMFTRDRGYIAAGAGICIAGLVLASQLTGGAAVAAAFGTNVGNGVMGAIAVSALAKVGDYKLIFVEPTANAGTFIVEGPDGIEVGHGNVAAPFAAGGLSFTLADGATDFASGDSFTISVTGAVKYLPYDPISVTGLQYATAILWSGWRDATTADRRAVLNTSGPMKIQAAELMWGANVTTLSQQANALAQLAKLGIRSV